MNQLNSVMIEGNLCRDAERSSTPSGSAICKMSIASNRYFKSGDGFEKEVSYFDVDTFGKTAEICGERGTKGIGIHIIDRLKQSRWQDKDGSNRSTVVIIADHVEFASKPKNGDSSAQNGAAFDEDIPF